MSSAGFQKLRSRLQLHGVDGLAPATTPKEQARRFIEKLREKNAFVHASGKPVDSTIGVILTNVKVKFVIPGSPGQRPVEGKRSVRLLPNTALWHGMCVCYVQSGTPSLF
jgi:hypothetical protein